MKPLEILSVIPKWARATPAQILASPAFAMPCKLGETTGMLRAGAVEPADTLDLALKFGNDPHTLGIARSARFPNLEKIWESCADVPEPVLLALVEKDCGQLLQLLENAVRRQVKVVGVEKASDTGERRRSSNDLLLGVSLPSPNGENQSPVIFSLTRSETVVSAFGNLRYLDLTNSALRAETLPSVTEHAAFVLPASELTALSLGDAILLPEVESVAPRLIVDGRFAVDGSGVLPFADDGRTRVLAAETSQVSLGELFDAAAGTSNVDASQSGGSACERGKQLLLVQNGRTLAYGRLDLLADQPAFIVESLHATTSH